MNWTPPTPTPEAGQGPWCDLSKNRWWVVAESISEAVEVVRAIDADVFPITFGWRAIIEPTCIRWVDPADWNEENEIVECMSNHDGAVDAWRITIEGR